MWSQSLSAAVPFHYRSTLLSSGLFDTQFYAVQAGIAPNLDRCVSHYLSKGGLAGLSPNRLFDGAAYLSLHPDVAAARMDPFLHFVVFGISEGRRSRIPQSYLEVVGSIPPEALAERRVVTQAFEMGWRRDQPSIWTNTAVAVYASSLGNFFFRHIADRIVDGLRASGVRAHRLDQNSLRPSDVSADLFVAPHEFFRLGSGSQWRTAPAVADSIMLNTEQPGTPWYFQALQCAGPSATLIDLSPQSAVLLRDFNRYRSGYFPVGLLPPGLPSPGKAGDNRPNARGFEAPPAGRSGWFSQRVTDWRDRPIDVLFLGTLTPRRSEALARLAPSLARYKCFIHAPTGLGGPLTGAKSTLGIEQSLALARNAKVLLNIHRDEFAYFEWHRVMMLGIEQGAVVLSEPCFASPGVEPGRHFVPGSIERMPESLSTILGSAEGERLAKQIDTFKAGEMRERFDLKTELSALAFLHNRGFSRQ
jgi:hypothetical protein